MNKERASSAEPARTAQGAVGGSRPLDAVLAAIFMLLGLLFRATPGSALACALVTQLLTLLGALFRRRARAATPEQHARALRDLRCLHAVHTLPRRTPRIRPSRAARRRIAECWRMLVNPPRRRASYARPVSTRARPRHAQPHLTRRHSQPRARPPPAEHAPNPGRIGMLI